MAANAQEIINEVISKRAGVWDAFNQGRYSFHIGVPLEADPYRIYDQYFRTRASDWNRGWISEQEAQGK